MALVFVDTETTGLDESRHQIWEAAYAVQDGEVRDSLLFHDLTGADPKALKVNGYRERALFAQFDPVKAMDFEEGLQTALAGNTLVAANPAFDAKFLAARWGSAPWKYRLLDVEAYAMGALGWNMPHGLADIRDALLDRFGFTEIQIPAPDHSAKGDVYTLRACFQALQMIYKRTDHK